MGCYICWLLIESDFDYNLNLKKRSSLLNMFVYFWVILCRIIQHLQNKNVHILLFRMENRLIYGFHNAGHKRKEWNE